MTAPESIPPALLAGLAAGAVHVLSGPDHLAAVLPFSAGARRKWWVGLSWGVGHSVGVLVLGCIALAFDLAAHVEGISAIAERVVGVSLVGLGLWTLRRSGLVMHAHRHPHRESTDVGHVHVHVHVDDPSVDAPDHAERGRHADHAHSSLGFGVLHGVAGTGHLFGVVPALLLETGAAVAYLGAYLVGSAASMCGFAAIAGRLVGGRGVRLAWGLRLSGALALGVGVFWLGQSLA